MSMSLKENEALLSTTLIWRPRNTQASNNTFKFWQIAVFESIIGSFTVWNRGPLRELKGAAADVGKGSR